MLLVGSQAAKQYFDIKRTPLDSDYICTMEEFEKWYDDNFDTVTSVYPFKHNYMVAKTTNGIFEFEIAKDKESSAYKLLEYCAGVSVAPLEVLYLLKMSHRFKKNSPHFLKTMRDIRAIRNNLPKDFTFDKKLKAILKLREKETYDYAHPSLAQNKKNFFTDSVPYQYDHDSIHRAVAIGSRPAYLEYIKDGEEVMSDKQKWDALPDEIKLNGVIEESYVLAIERALVPFGNNTKVTPESAFMKALSKVCTSITSGWFRSYAWENYERAVSKFDPSYYDKFKLALDAGTILPYTKGY